MAHEATEKLYPIRVLHDYWPGNSFIDETTGLVVEERIKAGSIVEVSMEEALKLLEHKVAERVDPLR